MAVVSRLYNQQSACENWRSSVYKVDLKMLNKSSRIYTIKPWTISNLKFKGAVS